MDLSTEIEDLANEHLADTNGSPSDLLHRLGAKIRRQERAVHALQDRAASVSAHLRTIADTPVRAMADKEERPSGESSSEARAPQRVEV